MTITHNRGHSPSFSPDPASQPDENIANLAYQSLLLDLVHDAVIGTDADLVIRYWNKSAERLFGWRADEAIGNKTDDLFRSELPAAELEQVFMTIRNQPQTHFTGVGYNRDGKPLFLDVTTARMGGTGDALRGYAVTIRDLSEQTRTNAVLREGQERMGLVLRAARMIQWEWDACEDRLSTTGDTAAFFGLPDGKNFQHGEDALVIVHPEDRERHRERVALLLQEGGEYYDEYRIIRPDNGEVAWLEEWCVAVRGSDGQVRKLTGVAKNVSERKQAEQRIRELNQALEAERSRWQGVVEGIADEVWFCDMQGKMSMMNLRTVTPMGLEEFRDRPLEETLEEVDILTPDGRLRVPTHEPLLRALRGEIVRGEEIMRHRRTGRERQRQYSAAPTRASDGTINGAVAIVRDITEYRQAVEALHQSREMLRDFLESTHDGFFALDREWRFVYINRQYLERVGMRADELIGKNIWEALPLYAGTRLEQYCRIAMAQRTPLHFESTGYHLNNWYEISIYPTQAGIAVFSTDRTEEKKAEEALRASEERLQLAQEAAGLGSWEWVPGNENAINNEIFFRIHGMDPTPDMTDYLEKYLTLVHPLDRQRMRETIEASKRGEAVVDTPYRIIRPDGSVRWMQSFRKNIFEKGQLARQIGAVMDITERVESEMALHESEERFRLAVSAINEGLWDAYLDDGRMWWNEAYDRQFGPRPPEAQWNTRWWFDRIHPEDIQRVGESFAQALASGGDHWACEYRFRLADGSYAIVRDRALITRGEQGKAVRVTGAMQDLTEQRRLEAQQMEYATQMEVQRRLMEQREQERQAIARDIHDGPVQTLSSTIFNLQYVKDAFQAPALRVELDQIRLNVKSAVQELREVINELRPPALLRFGLARAIEQHADDFREKHPEIRLRLDLAMEEIEMSEQATLVLFRIYQEALANVVRHAQAARANVRFAKTEAGLLLEIRDEGKGFNIPEDLSGLTETRHYGLAGMRERAEAIGGMFAVESTPGQGTVIRVVVQQPTATGDAAPRQS